MFGTGEDTMAREIDNVRFMIEQQLQLINMLDRQGLDRAAALDLLKRLTRQDEDLRLRMTAQGRPVQIA